MTNTTLITSSSEKHETHRRLNALILPWMSERYNNREKHTIHSMPATSGRQEVQLLEHMKYLETTAYDQYPGKLITYDRKLDWYEVNIKSNSTQALYSWDHKKGDIWDYVGNQESQLTCVWYDLLCGLSDTIIEKLTTNVKVMKPGSLVFLTLSINATRNVTDRDRLGKLWSQNGLRVKGTAVMDRLFLTVKLLEEVLGEGTMVMEPYVYRRTSQSFAVVGFKLN